MHGPDSPSLEQALAQRLAALDAGGLRRRERTDRASAVACSNVYIADPAHFGASGSRLITGSHAAHRTFEADIAAWQGTQAALLFNSGYNANVGLLSALADRGDAVFSDALNHASIIDGVRLSRAERHIYPHSDVAALGRALGACDAPGLRVVMTESIFSMDGDLAPLADLVDVCQRHHAVLCLDEAHALGVLGEQGRGAAHAAGLADEIPVRVGTCGKAMSGFGAFVAGSSLLREFLYNRARSFVFTTALPTSVVEGNAAGLARVRDGVGQAQLWRNINAVAALLSTAGWWSGIPQGPIFPIMVGDNDDAMALAAAMDARGFFVQAIRPPTVPAGTSRLRLTVSSGYDDAFIAQLVGALVESAAALGIAPRSAL